jgi:hypothetical protein
MVQTLLGNSSINTHKGEERLVVEEDSCGEIWKDIKRIFSEVRRVNMRLGILPCVTGMGIRGNGAL